jgi:hypothetical protein
LEITTRSGKPTSDNAPVEVHRPSLLAGGRSIPVEINLWSITYPITMRRPAIEMTAATTAGEQAVMRFDQLAAIAESATPAAFQLPVPDGYNWYRAWSAMLTRLQSEATNALALSSNEQAPTRISRPVEEQLAAASARFEAWTEQCTAKLVGPDIDEDATPVPAGELSRGGTSSAERAIHCVTDGALDRLSLDVESTNVNWGQSSMVGPMAIAALALAVVVLAHRTRALDLLYQWPHASSFLIGIAWWAWLQPSWFGLVIAAASVAFAMRSGWPGRAIRLDGSTVVRASRPK